MGANKQRTGTEMCSPTLRHHSCWQELLSDVSQGSEPAVNRLWSLTCSLLSSNQQADGQVNPSPGPMSMGVNSASRRLREGANVSTRLHLRGPCKENQASMHAGGEHRVRCPHAFDPARDL